MIEQWILDKIEPHKRAHLDRLRTDNENNPEPVRATFHLARLVQLLQWSPDD